MPAPKYLIGQTVVAADGTKGQIVTVFDFGEDKPAEYSIKSGRRTIENIPETILSFALAEQPAPAPEAPAAEPAGEAGSEAAASSGGDQPGA